MLTCEARYHNTKGYQGAKQFTAETPAEAKRLATAKAYSKDDHIFLYAGREGYEKLNGRWYLRKIFE